MDTAQGRQYLFVTGCARSGTTMMADLLRADPRIAMGRERYAYRYIFERALSPELFEAERFCCQWHSEDSHHRSLQPYYSALYPAFERCRLVGDKIPEIACDYRPLLTHFKRPRVIYMLRNLADVANSYRCRAREAAAGQGHGWPAQRGVVEAVLEWNLSLTNTLRHWNDMHVLVLPYETLFVDPAQLERLRCFLQLGETPEIDAEHARLAVRGAQLDRERRLGLSPAERMLVQQHADAAAYAALLQRAGLGGAVLRHALQAELFADGAQRNCA